MTGLHRARSFPAVRRVRRWPVWSAPRGLIGYLLVVVVVTASLLVTGLCVTPLSWADWGVWCTLLGCATLCVEAARRAGEPAGVANDLLSAWTLPVALLLPPVLAVLAPVPLTVLKQLRVRSGLWYRRVASASAIGLANGAASVAFSRLTAHSAPGDGAALLSRSPAAVLAALAAGLLCWAVNVALIGTAARLASPEFTWRELVGDRDQAVLDVGETCLGVVVAVCWSVTPLLAVVMLVPVLLAQRGLTLGQLRAAARTDPKTGLLNAGAWQQEAEREIVRAGRARRPLAVLLVDLDHFKQVNDTHGHLVGDRVLRAAAHAFADCLRPYDLLGRFGGEEFTVLLPDTDQDQACATAERIRCQLDSAPLAVEGIAVAVTVSVGVATLGRHGEDLTDLLTAADLALYRAKADGRNRVSPADSTSWRAPRQSP